MRWQRYEVMSSIQETMSFLAQHKGKARMVAGGTDLMVQIRAMREPEEQTTLLDISRVEEMRSIVESGSFLLVGAAVTMAELAGSPLAQNKAKALAQGAGWMGSPQIRNVATIGGNVVNAQPAADGNVPLTALGATARISSPEGRREVAIGELCLGVGTCSINPSRELVTHFKIPLCQPPLQASAMRRMSKRKAFTLPQLSAAVRVELNESAEKFQRVKIVAAPVSPVPWRAMRAEEALAGVPVTMDAINAAAALAREDASPRDSLRGSAEYRKEMVEVLVRRALLDALSELGRAPRA